MKEHEEIDRLFQTTFDGFELTPDSSVKEGIDRAIAVKEKRRRFLFILFPMLFGTFVLATVLYFSEKSKPDKLSNSKKIYSENKNGDSILSTTGSKPEDAKKSSLRNQEEKSRFEKSPVNGENFRTEKAPQSAKDVNLIHTEKSPEERKILPTSNIEHLTNVENKNPDVELSSTQTKITPEELDPNEISGVNKPDSSLTLSPDSALIRIPKINQIPPSPEKNNLSKKWSYAIIGGWEGEKRRPNENFDSTGFYGQSKEFARIHTSVFYGKLELNRKLTGRLDLILGLGFRSVNLEQHGSLYTLDSTFAFEGVISVPNSYVYFFNKQSGIRSYRINSIIAPLGISYLMPISERLGLRVSAATELAYGWSLNNQLASDFSKAKFRAFGLNVCLRPEIDYTIGNIQLFGFGTFNQSVYQQLKWDFEPKRNPAFGAGAGVRIQF